MSRMKPRTQSLVIRSTTIALGFFFLLFGSISEWVVLPAVGVVVFGHCLLYRIRCPRCNNRLYWSGLFRTIPKKCPNCGEPT